MKWIAKAFAQKTISLLPFSHQINFILQRTISVGRELPSSFVLDRINHARNHYENFKKYSSLSIEQAKILEIGTGWYPIVPIAFFLAGTNAVETRDIKKLYNKVSVNQTIRAFLQLHESHSLIELIPNFQPERIENLYLALREPTTLNKLKLLKITATQGRINSIDLPDISKDLIVSNNTFQFIEKETLPHLFAEMHRIGAENSILSLAVDFTDEFSHFDSSITQFNFLKFSERKWRFITSSLNSTNRLRYSDYYSLLSLHFHIVTENLCRGETQELQGIKIDNEFNQYELSDLLITHVNWIGINKT